MSTTPNPASPSSRFIGTTAGKDGVEERGRSKVESPRVEEWQKYEKYEKWEEWEEAAMMLRLR